MGRPASGGATAAGATARGWARGIAVTGALGAAALAAACTQSLDFSSVSSAPPKGDGGSGDSAATSSGDGGGGGFCASLPSTPTLCDDFDDPARPLGAVWDGLEQTNGVVAPDTTVAASGTDSLKTSTSAIAAGGTVRAVVKKFFPDSANEKVSFDIQFKMRVESFDPAPSGGQVIAFAILFGTDADFNQLVLNLNSTGAAVTAQLAENSQGIGSETSSGYDVHGPFPDKPPIGKWMTVHIQLDVQSPTGVGNTLRVFFDDVAEFEGSLTLPLKGGQPRIELGVGWAAAPAAPWTVRYDDFVADLKHL